MSTATPTRQAAPVSQTFGIVFDGAAALKEIATKWRWILAAGIVSVVGGTFALLAPVIATGVVATFIAATLFVVGCFNMAGICFAEKGLKLESFLTGLVQALLAAVMAFYPFESLMSLTIMLAIVLLVDGIARIALAVSARQLPGWGWTLAGGIAGVVTSALVFAALPMASFWVIGVLAGVAMITTGATRIAIALKGRQLAKAVEVA